MKASDVIRALEQLGEDCSLILGDGRILYWRDASPEKIYVLWIEVS